MEKNAVKICQPKEGHGVFGWAWDSTFACEKRRMGSARGYGWLVLWTSHLGAPLVHLQTSQYYLDGRCSSSTQDHAYSISTPFFFLSKTTVSKQMADSKAWAAATKAPCHGKSAACVLC
jgi:hypothetical protein